MQEQSIRKLIGTWLKKRYLTIILTLLMILDYIGIAGLMHLNLEAIMYSTYLVLFTGSGLALFDFRKYVRRYKLLITTYYNRSYSLEGMPIPQDLIEETYQILVETLSKEILELKQQMSRQEEEANDYYTLWTHQIKTPIAAMRLILQNQKYREETENQDERILLEGELFKIEQYAEMALGYLRLDSMSQDLVLKQYKLYDIVAKALKKYAICFMSKKLSINIEPFETEVVTDEKWLQFVIEQMISNSIKYTHEGSIYIGMKDEYTLMISDTGIGIQSEDLPRIFERGFTGYNGRMDKKSTGIGLYLCKKVTHKLGHTLEVSSTLGKGTTFYIGFQSNEAVLILQE